MSWLKKVLSPTLLPGERRRQKDVSRTIQHDPSPWPRTLRKKDKGEHAGVPQTRQRAGDKNARGRREYKLQANPHTKKTTGGDKATEYQQGADKPSSSGQRTVLLKRQIPRAVTTRKQMNLDEDLKKASQRLAAHQKAQEQRNDELEREETARHVALDREWLEWAQRGRARQGQRLEPVLETIAKQSALNNAQTGMSLEAVRQKDGLVAGYEGELYAAEKMAQQPQSQQEFTTQAARKVRVTKHRADTACLSVDLGEESCFIDSASRYGAGFTQEASVPVAYTTASVLGPQPDQCVTRFGYPSGLSEFREDLHANIRHLEEAAEALYKHANDLFQRTERLHGNARNLRDDTADLDRSIKDLSGFAGHLERELRCSHQHLRGLCEYTRDLIEYITHLHEYVKALHGSLLQGNPSQNDAASSSQTTKVMSMPVRRSSTALATEWVQKSTGARTSVHTADAWLDIVVESSAGWEGMPTTADPHYPHLEEAGRDEPFSPSIPMRQDRECVVCGDSKSPLEFPARPPTAACEHRPQTCSECLASWMTSEVDTKGIEGVKCSECDSNLTYNDIHRAASPDTFAKYEKLTIRAALGALPNFAWCLSPYCDSGQENVPDASFMECRACGYRQCLPHRMPWHEEETCNEYDYRVSGQQARDAEERRRGEEERRRQEQRRTEESMTLAMLDSVSKPCPNPRGCGWRIQKNDGCDHMTCRHCRWEFCWPCLASQVQINRIGNSAHLRSCPHYA